MNRGSTTTTDIQQKRRVSHASPCVQNYIRGTRENEPTRGRCKTRFSVKSVSALRLGYSGVYEWVGEGDLGERCSTNSELAGRNFDFLERSAVHSASEWVTFSCEEHQVPFRLGFRPRLRGKADSAPSPLWEGGRRARRKEKVRVRGAGKVGMGNRTLKREEGPRGKKKCGGCSPTLLHGGGFKRRCSDPIIMFCFCAVSSNYNNANEAQCFVYNIQLVWQRPQTLHVLWSSLTLAIKHYSTDTLVKQNAEAIRDRLTIPLKCVILYTAVTGQSIPASRLYPGVGHSMDASSIYTGRLHRYLTIMRIGLRIISSSA